MQLSATDYHRFFSQLQAHIYQIDDSILQHLREEERFLLSKYGLPSHAIEILDFEHIPTTSADLPLEDVLFIFGSVYESAKDSYLFIDRDYRIKLFIDDKLIHVNDNLEKFLTSLMEYALFIEEMNKRSDILGSIELTNEDYFEIYYRLRLIDKSSTTEASLWQRFIFDEFVYEKKVYEFNAE